MLLSQGLETSIKAPARPVQQMICHELQLETIRRRELLQACPSRCLMFPTPFYPFVSSKPNQLSKKSN